MNGSNEQNKVATSDRDEFAEALGGEVGGKVDPRTLTWECVCGVGGTGGALDLYRHRQRAHVSGRSTSASEANDA